MTSYNFEADIAEGIEDFGLAELRLIKGLKIQLVAPGTIRFNYSGNLARLLQLKAIQAIYLVGSYPAARPKALLGDQNFRAILEQIQLCRSLHAPDSFKTLFVSAAGANSAVMLRFKAELAKNTRLALNDNEGDLLIRLRVGAGSSPVWEVLTRITPRPLATRKWRVCNYEGALNATVAYSMVQLTQPEPDDIFLNLACGSATLMVERLDCGSVGSVIGCDISPQALDCAKINLQASGHAEKVGLINANAACLPLPDNSVNKLCADFPFGNLVGSVETNQQLYPAFLQEAARVSRPGAIFVLIVQQHSLIENALRQMSFWRKEQPIKVSLSGFTARIYILHKV